MKIFLRFFLIFGVVWLIARSAIYLLPGNPAEFLYQETLVQTSPEMLRQKLDLPDTWVARIFSVPKNESLVRHEKSQTLIQRALVKSSILTALSILITIPTTILLLFLHFRRGKSRKSANFLGLILASIPVFILGPLALRWLAVPNPIPPVLCLSAHLTGFWFLALSRKVDRFLPTSSVQGSRARGFNESTIFLKDCLFPLLGGMVGYLGTQIGALFNGSLLVEVIFQWHGLGSLIADSVMSRDYPVVELSLLVVTFITLFCQQLGQLAQKRWERNIP